MTPTPAAGVLAAPKHAIISGLFDAINGRGFRVRFGEGRAAHALAGFCWTAQHKRQDCMSGRLDQCQSQSSSLLAADEQGSSCGDEAGT